MAGCVEIIKNYVQTEIKSANRALKCKKPKVEAIYTSLRLSWSSFGIKYIYISVVIMINQSRVLDSYVTIEEKTRRESTKSRKSFSV